MPPRRSVPVPVETVRMALGARYDVAEQVGRGAMAGVFQAVDREGDAAVAIKVLRPEFAIAVGAERFRQEIAILSALAHPNLLSILDSGKTGGILYYTMPYLSGGTLAERLAQEMRLPIDEALGVAVDVAAALDYAHGRNVVHRDIKPENIMFDANGRALVCDFGVARAIERSGGDRISSSGLVVGTPAYMSPEQASGAVELDGRSDIYSLACVVFEMLVGEPPFMGRTAQVVMARHVNERPPSVRVVRAEVSNGLDAALMAALAKDPTRRPPSGAAFVQALSRP
jgi:serine/threonine protein kinase